MEKGKRNVCPNMDILEPGLTQAHGLANDKRYRSASSENSGIESSYLTKMSKSMSITCTDDGSLLKKTKMAIGRFFYENGLDFSTVKSPSFQRMMSLVSGKTKNQIPTCQELKGWIFNDAVKEMREYVEGIKKSWSDTGCSILLDGWRDANERCLINILVDCPKGTIYLRSSDISDFVGNVDVMLSFLEEVIKEVGDHNVVQIITNSKSAFMKEVGKQLMEKYRSIFWTVSASYCIELMLEKFEEIDLIKETMEKAKIITRFVNSNPDAREFLQEQTKGSELVNLNPSKLRRIQHFITLENIVFEKETLKKMFLSDNESLILTSTTEGKRVADMVADRSFWSGASTIVNGAIPLVRVIEWINESNQEQIGYISETIDQAKETIKEGFKHTKSQYMQFWKAIDDVWNEVLYSPLHSAGYFFNPNLFYSSDMFIDPEVATGLLCCIVRSTNDLRVQDRITFQMEQYRTAKTGDFFKGYGAVAKRSDISPALWWSEYGGECPELQRLAVRILSQTCDGASKFQLKRSLTETLLAKGRNQVGPKRLIDMIFVQHNMQLQNFASGKTEYIALDEIDKGQNDAFQNDETTWMESDGGYTIDRGITDLEAPSGYHPKVETI